MKCETCGAETSPDDRHEHAGKILCEDCYLDAVATPKTCDPWAVYIAKKSVSQNMRLTPEQQRIVALIKTKGPLTLEQICAELGISEGEFRTDFAILRHMELAGACKREGQIHYTRFDDPAGS